MSSTSLPSLPQLSPPPASSNTASSRPQISSTQRTAEARAAFVASLQAVGQSLDNDLQSRAKTIHENAKVLTEQEKKLAKSTKQLQKDTLQLEKFVEKSTKGGKGAMSEFDDLEGLLGNLEGDLDILERTLGLVEGNIEEQEGGVDDEERPAVAGEEDARMDKMEEVENGDVLKSNATGNGNGNQPER